MSDPEGRVLAIAKPDPDLMKVYFIRALGAGFGLIFVIGLIALKVGHEAVAKGVHELAKRGILPFALIGLYATGYFISLAFFFVRYRTLRYRFDQDGVAQAWGLLFRRESFVAYPRIQDVRVSQGIVERLFGVGTVRIQTAGGAKGAEEALEGLREHALVGDFLRARMRGGKLAARPAAVTTAAEPANDPIHVLGEIRDELRALRGVVEQKKRA